MQKQLQETQKVTIRLPKELLTDARQATHKGITETIKEGLELLIRIKAYERLKEFRGKYQFPHNLDKLREDRS